MNPNRKLAFASDYMEGTHPQILKRLVETNMQHFTGYGMDDISESARDKIRAACEAPDAEVYFLVGGTQANATMIDAALRSYQGVIAANTGHISTHEAGAIELSGHKVLTLPQNNGKISAEQIRGCIEGYWQDDNHEHTVMPGLVYLSQPTEYGTLYSLEELTQISAVCHANNVALYVDGARLAYALACPENDVTLPDLASLCDAFYIGGTKCSALFGEAVVIPRRGFIPHLFTIIKQHGALLAKGWVAGLQFRNAIDAANRLRAALDAKGYAQPFVAPTNQIFVALSPERAKALSRRVEMGFWEKLDDNRTVMRIATSWATQKEDVDKLIECL